MFNASEVKSKDSFLEQTKVAREERAFVKKQESAAITIQAKYRGWKAKLKFKQTIIQNFDDVLSIELDDLNKGIELKPCIDVYKVGILFLSIYNENDEEHVLRFERFCRYVVKSLESDSPKISYIGVGFMKDLSLPWIRHIKLIGFNCCNLITQLKPENHSDSLSLALCLHTLFAFTSTSTWVILQSPNFVKLKTGMSSLCNNIMFELVGKGLYKSLRSILIKGTCKSPVTLKSISLTAIIRLAIRPAKTAGFVEKLLKPFMLDILSVPGILYNIEQINAECIQLFQTNDVLQKCLHLLADKQNMIEYFETLKASYSLALLANVIYLFYLEPQPKKLETIFTTVVTEMFQIIPLSFLLNTTPTVAQWHELLGWYTPNPESIQADNLPVVKKQIQTLWSNRVVKLLLGDLLKSLTIGYESVYFGNQPATTTNPLKKFIDQRSSLNNFHISGRPWRSQPTPEIDRIAAVCSMYTGSLSAISHLRLDILSGLCYYDTLLYDLFLLLTTIGPNCGFKFFFEYCAKPTPPYIFILTLFCELMTHYVTLLDDLEMYEQQNPFKLSDFIGLSYFLNYFLYRLIYDPYFNSKLPIYSSVTSLLLCLYRRDCRRSFTPPNHWLIGEIKSSHFFSEADRHRINTAELLRSMPHAIPHHVRVKLFRKYVVTEKISKAYNAPNSSIALISIHRERIVEDGYRQLALLPAGALKSPIRVRFINQQGLDEVGIDQDGVFKEFLEETIKRVFDPALNLFKITNDQRLYPSPTSYMQDNHLQLFEFVGSMLGKAVYEGIVVDVPFASFFLSQLLGIKQKSYSCIDELPSLDQELYRNLTYIKHYEGDVSELDLTFSVNEEQLGKIVTHELYPGGRARPVTNENKISYIYNMAYFRMHTQIREQAAAFIRGFRSIVRPEWLRLFSPPELQRLISGDIAPLDIKDLRKHTQYYGGFHDSHRVINWLWEILAQDFTLVEQKLFLKFVTSCSNPPLLGFAYLEPPFSVRCVEVSDDDDVGDTIGSVIRGFFTIRKREPPNRLPTSSTCFNILKLPNYQKKVTLRDKLRYAITCNTGFELS